MGAHVLRHTTASRLVRAGVSFKQVADVMRHRDIDTTMHLHEGGLAPTRRGRAALADGGGVMRRPRKQRRRRPGRSEVREYLALRTRLGSRCRTAGEELLPLRPTSRRSGHRGPLTADIAIDGRSCATNAKPEYWAWRLRAVRLFVKHLAATEPGTRCR